MCALNFNTVQVSDIPQRGGSYTKHCQLLSHLHPNKRSKLNLSDTFQPLADLSCPSFSPECISLSLAFFSPYNKPTLNTISASLYTSVSSLGELSNLKTYTQGPGNTLCTTVTSEPLVTLLNHFLSFYVL